MSETKKISYYSPLFLKDFKTTNSSSIQIKEKEKCLADFQSWLNESNIEFPNQINQKTIENYKLFLASKKNNRNKPIATQTQKKYLKTAALFLDFLSSKEVCSIRYQDCFDEKEETDIQKLITYYFQTKGLSLDDLKENAKKRKIIYSRYTKPAKDLLELSESLSEAKKAIDIVSKWAKSRNLDYAIETVFKKWPELKSLKPKEKEIKPFYRNDRMIKSREKWYVIDKDGNWLEFAGKEDEIEWR